MGRAPCCSKLGLHRGPWTAREDALLASYIQNNGEGNWRSLPKKAGLLRCGKSCRLRWMNYLRPDIKRGNISPEEEDLITRLHRLLGNRWSLIAGRLPGRTDNEIKNYWNSHLSKKLKKQGFTIREGTPRKKREENTNHHKKNKNNNSNNKLIDKAKIYVPKPIRLKLSWTEDYVKGTLEASSGSNEVEFDKTIVGFLDTNHLDFAVDFSMQDESLQRLFDEYSQLLQLGVDVK